MERESLHYKIVMDDGADAEVLGRLASLTSPAPLTWPPSSGIPSQHRAEPGARIVNAPHRAEAKLTEP
jgi:hypothetical protein